MGADELDLLNREKTQLSQQVQNLTAQISAFEGEVDAAKAKAAKEMAKLEAETAKRKAELEGEIAPLAILKQQLEEIRGSIVRAKEQLNDETAQLRKERHDVLTKLNSDIQVKEARLAAASAIIASMRDKVLAI